MNQTHDNEKRRAAITPLSSWELSVKRTLSIHRYETAMQMYRKYKELHKNA